jgi:hypothetical protein
MSIDRENRLRRPSSYRQLRALGFHALCRRPKRKMRSGARRSHRQPSTAVPTSPRPRLGHIISRSRFNETDNSPSTTRPSRVRFAVPQPHPSVGRSSLAALVSLGLPSRPNSNSLTPTSSSSLEVASSFSDPLPPPTHFTPFALPPLSITSSLVWRTRRSSVRSPPVLQSSRLKTSTPSAGQATSPISLAFCAHFRTT